MASKRDNFSGWSKVFQGLLQAGSATTLGATIQAAAATPLGLLALAFACCGVGTYQVARHLRGRRDKRTQTDQVDMLRALASEALGPKALDDPETFDRALHNLDDEHKPFAILLQVLTRRRDPTALDTTQIRQLLEHRLPAFIQRHVHLLADSQHALAADIARETVAALRRIEQAIDRDHTPFLETPCESTFPDRAAVDCALSRFVFSRRMTPLFGREDELERLYKFLLEPGTRKTNFCWWLWSGPAGSGKSRLALELVLEMQYHGWRAGFLPRKEGDFDWARWQPAEPTLVVVDYAAERIDVARSLAVLHRNAPLFLHPVRFLLLERTADNDDLWLRNFLEANGNANKETLLACQYDQPHALAPLSDDDLWATVEYVVGALKPNMNIAAAREPVLAMLRQAHGNERQNYQRPLYAAFAAETIVAQGIENVRRWRAPDLTESVLVHEMARWKNHGLDTPHINLVALATMLRGLDTAAFDTLPHTPPDLSGILPAHNDYRPSRYHTALGARRTNGRIAALEPDILGELFVLERLSGRPLLDRDPDLVAGETRKLLAAAWRLDPNATADFLFRAGADFPDYGADAGAGQWKARALRTLCAPPPPESGDNARAVWTFAAAALTGVLGNAGQYQRVIELADLLCHPDRAQTIPAPLRAHVLLNRGVAYGELQPPQTAKAIADYAAVNDMPDAPAEQKALALFSRGVALASLGQRAAALHDVETAEHMAHMLDDQVRTILRELHRRLDRSDEPGQ